MEIRVRVPSQLRTLVNGESSVTIPVGPPTPGGARPDAPTVRAVLDQLAAMHPALERRVRDERGQTRVHVNLFVGSDNVRDLAGLDTPVPAGTDLSIIPAISGG